MRRTWMFAILAGALAASSPSTGQVRNDTGIPTETQERLRSGFDATEALNWLGLLGLIGLLGLRRGHDEDSYHPADVE